MAASCIFIVTNNSFLDVVRCPGTTFDSNYCESIMWKNNNLKALKKTVKPSGIESRKTFKAAKVKSDKDLQKKLLKLYKSNIPKAFLSQKLPCKIHSQERPWKITRTFWKTTKQFWYSKYSKQAHQQELK